MGTEKQPLTENELVLPTAKACERLTLVVEFNVPQDHVALADLIEVVKLYGSVTKATHAVLRRTKRALV